MLTSNRNEFLISANCTNSTGALFVKSTQYVYLSLATHLLHFPLPLVASCSFLKIGQSLSIFVEMKFLDHRNDILSKIRIAIDELKSNLLHGTIRNNRFLN